MNKYINGLIAWGLSKINSSAITKEYHNRGKGRQIDYTRQAVVLHRKEVKDFTKALTSATDPDDPRLGDWMRFREVMTMDGHLMSCVENRILPVQCAPFKLIDNAGNEAPTEVKKLLDRPWRLDMVKIICSHTFEGPKLVEMFDLNQDGELKKVSEIPQSNFIPQKGIILDKEYDNAGTSYKEGVYKNYYFQVGDDWNLGLFSQLATIVLAKKLGLGAWLSYIDKYGVPPIFAITDRMDSTRRDELFEMLQSFRMNHFAVLQGNEKIETPQGYNVDAYNTFKSLMTDIADREIEKRIQGSSGLTNEKAFVGAAEIQERILGYRLQVDKLIFKYYFNTEVIPRLVKLSPVYGPLEKYNTYEYDESETLSMKEILEALKSLSQYYEFDIKELAKITGLPITKIRASIGQAATDQQEEETQTRKKKDKISAFFPLRAYPGGTFPKAGSFLIYAGTWEKAFEELIEKIYRKKSQPEDLDREFILKTYDRLNKAARGGYGKDYYTDQITRKMRQNLLEFAATKTHVQQEELWQYRNSIDDKKLYTEEAKKYLDLQNGTYLDVQTAWAARSAQSARQWQEFQRDKDIYPRLKFRTMNDNDVRPTHSVLEGIVKNVDDPFVDEHMTPLDPRCRCWWEQTREELTDWTPDYTPNPQWAGNPGKTGEIFNRENSYNQQLRSKEVRLSVLQGAELAKEYLPYNLTIQSGENRVHVNDFADPADLAQNIEAAKKMAKELEKDIYVRFHVDGGIVKGHKNPELGIGKPSNLADLKTYNGNSNFVNFTKAAIKSANKQGAEWVVIDISKQKDLSAVNRILYSSLGAQNRNIKRVVFIRSKKVVQITRKQIEKKYFGSLNDL